MATAGKTQPIAIGNSRGVRIAKPLLDQANLGAEIATRAEGLMIRSAHHPRAGWEVQFREIAESSGDRPTEEPIATAFDVTEWEW